MTGGKQQLICTLARCVRVISRSQAKRLLQVRDEANYRRLIRGLKDAGLVSEVTAWAKPVPEMKEALFDSSETGEPAPPEVFTQVIRQARARWAGLSAAPVSCLVGTSLAGKIYGVKRTGTLQHNLKYTHDLAVSELFVRLVLDGLIQEQDWHGEDSGDCRCGDKVADAVLSAGEEKPRQVLEVVGADYSTHKLMSISGYCESRGIPYAFF